MEKVAARSYGRNPDGSRRTAKQLIMQLGGGINIPNPTYSGNYRENRRWNEDKKVPSFYLTGDEKYNYTKTSPQRYEIGRHLKSAPNPSKRTIIQHKRYEDRLPISQWYSINWEKDNKDTFSGRHPALRIFGDKAKENVKKNKEIMRKDTFEEKKKFLSKYKVKHKQNKYQKELDSGKIPEALIGAGLLSAGMIGTKALYDKIKAKNEKNKREETKRELVVSK
jgi:hypothetical protein